MKYKILIIEDDFSFGSMLQNWFKKNDFDPILSLSIEQAKKEFLENRFNLVLTDLRLPDGDGIMFLEWIKEHKNSIPVIIMTSYGEIKSAISAIKIGALDYLQKPINPTELKQKIEQALNPNPTSKTIDKNTKYPLTDIIIGKSQLARQMYDYIKIVAPTRMSVLITGESGTGKESTARMIHELSTRKEAPFIAVDCGSFSKELAPSELFGHLKGSFTSAISDKKGIFEQANGGTVFLDEIGNLPYEVQVQLLRTLQEFKIRPVGSVNDIPVNIRLITATNEDLKTAIAEGRFREDLYHRINEFSITVPSLHERACDIPLFAGFFLEKANEELEKDIKGFSNESLNILKQYQWSGNLRELRNVVRRAALFAQSDEIVPENLPEFLLLSPYEEDISLKPENEPQQIEMALKMAKGNKALAARLLKIDRKTLYNKMHYYGMKL